MCVIAWAWRTHPDYPLVVLGNRDELHARPAEPAHWWPEAPAILAGRDAEAGGTWLGVTRAGRFAVVTNRRPGRRPPAAPSRGALAAGYLRSTQDAATAAAGIAGEAARYAGFNLLLADCATLEFVSNRESQQTLAPGVYAMANAGLDEPIPKVGRLRAGLAAWAHAHARPAPADWLAWLADAAALAGRDPLSAVFVRGARYGTRASTVLVLGATGDAVFIERRFAAGGAPLDENQFRFALAP